MTEWRRNLLDAVECCREEARRCDRCPMQETTCDELCVEMISLPAELVDMIEEELEDDE